MRSLPDELLLEPCSESDKLPIPLEAVLDAEVAAELAACAETASTASVPAASKETRRGEREVMVRCPVSEAQRVNGWPILAQARVTLAASAENSRPRAAIGQGQWW